MAGIRDTAIGLLTRREHSVSELGQKLQRKGFQPDDISRVLNELKQEKLLSDERFAEAYIASRIERGSGPLRIKAELRQRGVKDYIIEAGFEDQGENWLQRAEQVRRKRFGHSRPDEFQGRAKQARFLQYRGFTAEQVRRVLGDEVVIEE